DDEANSKVEEQDKIDVINDCTKRYIVRLLKWRKLQSSSLRTVQEQWLNGNQWSND
ncbi:hypothetical protein LINPERPRIM_LOCUS19991, partial [Linum perenne]